MSIILLILVFFGIGGIGLQILLSMLRNKVWGLIIPVIDLLAIVSVIVLGMNLYNSESILILYMVILSILFIAHCFIYGVARIIRKSMRDKEESLKSLREKEESLKLNQEDTIVNDQKRSIEEEMKRMEINDL